LKNAFFPNLKKYDFSVLTPKDLPIAFFRVHHSKERETFYKKRVNVFDKGFVDFL